MPLEQIRLSQAAKEQLLRLKRRTGIKNWNVLCRWGLCRSLAEPTPPSPVTIPADRARRQISATGKISAVGEVIWLRKITLVRSVTPAQSCSTIASGVVIGRQIGWLM